MDVGRNSVLHYLMAGKLARYILPAAIGSLNATIFLQRVIMPQDLLVCDSQFRFSLTVSLSTPHNFQNYITANAVGKKIDWTPITDSK